MPTKILITGEKDPTDVEERDCPTLPVRDTVVFPGVIMPLFVGRPRSLRAVESAFLQDKKLFVVAQSNNAVEDPEASDLYKVGTLCSLMQMLRLPDGTTKLLIEGATRMQTEEYRLDNEMFVAHITPVAWRNADRKALEPWRSALSATTPFSPGYRARSWPPSRPWTTWSS